MILIVGPQQTKGGTNLPCNDNDTDCNPVTEPSGITEQTEGGTNLPCNDNDTDCNPETQSTVLEKKINLVA